MISGIISSVIVIAGLGYGWAQIPTKAQTPTKDELKVAESRIEAQEIKTNYLFDRQMQSQIKEINRLEAKRNKTPDEIDQLNYLRGQLKEQRQMRSVR